MPLSIAGECNPISVDEMLKSRPILSVWALLSFIGSFVAARAFTTLYSAIVVETGGLHIHHFWYGIAMLAIGGWIGISYETERTNRIAAMIFGAGGGLIGDEVGLLLTFGDYWNDLTYTLVIMFLAIVSILILLVRYSKTVLKEFSQFSRRAAGFYFGVFLAAVSVWFILITDDVLIMDVSSFLALVGFAIVLAYLVQRLIRKR